MFSNYVLASREWKFSQETGLVWYIQHDTVGALLQGPQIGTVFDQFGGTPGMTDSLEKIA
jgi:hypothetical protein